MHKRAKETASPSRGGALRANVSPCVLFFKKKLMQGVLRAITAISFVYSSILFPNTVAPNQDQGRSGKTMINQHAVRTTTEQENRAI